MKPLWLLLLIATGYQIPFHARANDSSRLRLSLLTCTPGQELYSTFGHSALRVVDSCRGLDIVYNYGTFDFNDRDFYLKFIRGKLRYFISADRTEDFLYDYLMAGRGVTEQTLRLSPEEKQELWLALDENLKPENRFYLYDFFLDNCTTRPRDLLLRHIHPQPHLPAVLPATTRFRDAIHEYLDRGGQVWSKLGIDILLGLPTDRIMTPAEQQFLPDNLMRALDRCTTQSLVAEKLVLIPDLREAPTASGLSPFWVSSLLLLAFLLPALSQRPVFRRMAVLTDRLLFLFAGLMGVLLLLMWFATDHQMTRYNFNLLWALPTYLYAAFAVGKNGRGPRAIFFFSALTSALLLISWSFLPQNLNEALIPLVILLMLRSVARLRQIPSL